MCRIGHHNHKATTRTVINTDQPLILRKRLLPSSNFIDVTLWWQLHCIFINILEFMDIIYCKSCLEILNVKYYKLWSIHTLMSVNMHTSYNNKEMWLSFITNHHKTFIHHCHRRQGG